MVQAMQVSLRRPTGALQRVSPAQLYQTTAPAQTNGIGDLLTSIMPLIMIMMVFMMITPMMKGIAGAAS